MIRATFDALNGEFGGYVAALFNLNPLLERDGYHVLVDLLREPGLRRRAGRRLADVLSGRHSGTAGGDCWATGSRRCAGRP